MGTKRKATGSGASTAKQWKEEAKKGINVPAVQQGRRERQWKQWNSKGEAVLVMGMNFASKSFDFCLLLFYIPLLPLEFTIGIIFVQPFHTRKKATIRIVIFTVKTSRIPPTILF